MARQHSVLRASVPPMADDKPRKEKADALAAAALDPKNEDHVAEAIKQLSPEEAAHFVALLEKAIHRRRIQLFGYLVSLVVFLISSWFALAYFAAADEGEFTMWVFFIPFLLVALIFWSFGRWSNRHRIK